MVVLEKLTTGSIEEFKKIYSKSLLIESYDKKFFEQYNKQNFITKYLYRRFMYIIKIRNEMVGFIWHDVPISSKMTILALFIDDSYINKININTLNDFNDYILSYEAIDDTRNRNILSELGFIRKRVTLLMELKLNNYIKGIDCLNIMDEIKNNSKIMSILKKYSNTQCEDIIIGFKKFEIQEDEQLRCTLQNKIFSNYERIPITVEDIITDNKQDYFINDLCYFMYINNIMVGYGQVVFNRGMYTLVNFGIISEFRNLNLGKLFLNKLIQITKEKGIDKLFIRVEDSNINAKKLYEWCGFKYKYPITKWQRS